MDEQSRRPHAQKSPPAGGNDPFELFQFPPSFDIDRAALRRAWLRRSAELHPDRPGAAPDAAERLAALNLAKETLENPERRASALMSALGETPSTRVDALPDGFLMEILETREAMEDAQRTRDAARLAALDTWASQQRAEYETAFRARLARAQTPASTEDLRELRMILNAWRYVERMIEQLGAEHPER